MILNKSLPVVLVFILSFGILSIPYSCKKTKDIEASPTQADIVQKFFKVPDNASQALKNVINDIKKQDEKNHFVTMIATKFGLPAWDKSLSNIRTINNANARGLNDDSLQIFMIPFRGADSSITSYLLCTNNNGNVAYRYYKKDELSRLYAGNDSIRKLRSIFLSLFGYFEKSVNNNDSTFIGGIYQKYVSSVSVDFGQPTSGGRVTDVNMIRICWLGMLAARTQDPIDICYNLYIYGNDYDIRWGDYIGGSGLSGGTPSTMFPDGFSCPSYEWWCTTGDFRYINGLIVNPTSYPGMTEYFPWLWWEDPSWAASVPFSCLDFAIDMPDEPEINNGIELTTVSVGGATGPSRLIGYSPDRGNTEDMQFGTNGNPSGLYSHLLSKSNDELFSIMTSLFNSCTVFDNDLEAVGDLMIDRFRNSIGGNYENSVLNQKVQYSSSFKNYLKLFGEKLREKLVLAGGNINNVATINMENTRPVFDGFYNKFHGLQILINDTEYTEIELDNFSVSSDGKWNADVTVTIRDHFGLDKNDALVYQEWHQGFPSWWILQHMRNFRPFETVVKVKMRIIMTP